MSTLMDVSRSGPVKWRIRLTAKRLRRNGRWPARTAKVHFEKSLGHLVDMSESDSASRSTITGIECKPQLIMQTVMIVSVYRMIQPGVPPQHPHGLAVQRSGLILAAKDWAVIFPFRTTKVSVANSYELSAVSAVQTI